MSHTSRVAAAAILIFGLSAGARGQAPSCETETLHNCFLIRAPYGLTHAIAQRNSLIVLGEVSPGRPELVMALGPAALMPESVLANLQSDSDVVEAEMVGLAALPETALASGDTSGMVEGITQVGIYAGAETVYFSSDLWNGYADQPALDRIFLDATHAVPEEEAMGLGRVVAVIDTGVDPHHPLLQEALVGGYDFLLDLPGIASEWSALDPAAATTTRQNLECAAEQSYTVIVEGGGSTDGTYPASQPIVEQSYTVIVEEENLPSSFGHGTMVAGLVRLVAPGAKIMPLRAFNGEGLATVADVIEAIYFAVDNGASVINMSFSVSSSSNELLRAIKHAKKKKVMSVTSAGNGGSSALTYPAAYAESFGVASVDPDNRLSAFSAFGSDIVTVSAPGEGLVTTYPGGLYAAGWGTSFSAALVSGTVALLHTIAPDGTTKLEGHRLNLDALEQSAYQPDPANPNDALGAGILDTYGAFGLGPVGY